MPVLVSLPLVEVSVEVSVEMADAVRKAPVNFKIIYKKLFLPVLVLDLLLPRGDCVARAIGIEVLVMVVSVVDEDTVRKKTKSHEANGEI